jgi:16S rRNA (uracil1498-N3)-methyltransferase
MKKIHRFLVKTAPNGASITLEDVELVHLMKNVLKLSTHESCIVFADKSDDYICSIKSIEKKSIMLNVESIMPKRVIPKQITACISITKRDNFELVVQKLTELGIQTIVPIISGRTIKQALRIDRLQKISDEALEQSGGSTRVHILQPQQLEDSLIKNKDMPVYLFDMNGKSLSSILDKELVFYIGPEGGWSEEDKALFDKYQATVYTLGTTTLRAETAAIVASYKLIWD